MNFRYRLLIAATVALLGIQPVYGQWESAYGPYEGCRIAAITNIGSDVFVGTYNGIFHSTDNGVIWTRSNGGIENARVTRILSYQTPQGQKLLFACAANRVYTSSDYGKNWTDASGTFLPEKNLVRDIAADPESRTLYASTTNGLFSSIDNGLSWQSRNMPDGSSSFEEIIAFSDKIGTPYILWNRERGIYRSIDGGFTWTQVQNNSSYTPGPGYAGFSGLQAIQQPDGNWSVYVAHSDNHLWRSLDNGASWAALTSSPQFISSFDVEPNTQGELEILIIPSAAKYLYRSTDGGISWIYDYNTVDPLLMNKCIHRHGNTIFLGAYYGQLPGLYRSTDDGKTWVEAVYGLPTPPINTLAVDDSVVFATIQTTPYNDGHIYRLLNNNTVWEKLLTGIPDKQRYSLAIDRTGPTGSDIYMGTYAGGMFLSTNLGASWTDISTGLDPNPGAFSLAIVPVIARHSDVYAGTISKGVYLTTDRGGTWIPRNAGIEGFSIMSLIGLSDNQGGVTLYGGSNSNGTFRSTNSGMSWQQLNLNYFKTRSPFALATVSDSVGEQIILAAGYGTGVQRTMIDWDYWQPSNNGLIDTVVYCLAVSGETVFAGTPRGVFRSTNQGQSWQDVSENLPKVAVTALAASSRVLYVGTESHGVYRRPLVEMLPVPVEQPERPASLTLHQNFPNPVSSATGSGLTQIGYEIDKPGYVTLSVCNVLGTSRVVLVEDYKSTGTHTTQFDASGLPPGVYMYRLVAGNWRLQKKLLIID